MTTNPSAEYKNANGKYLAASTNEEKIEALEEMIRECPKHKSSENMLANLKTRHKKLKEQIIKAKKSGKSSFQGIRKESMQAILVGFTNTGKSALLSTLTNANPKVSQNQFTTTQPIIGMMGYATVQIQLIENPSIESEQYNKGLTNTADTIIIVITNLEQIPKIAEHLGKAQGKKIVVFNKCDLLNANETRKISANLQSKKYNFILVSTKTLHGIETLKNAIFQSFDKIRIYTKEPGKEKSSKPIVLEPSSTVKTVAEKILKGFHKKIKETKIWGPSSKFAGQKVGLQHQLKDLDVVEFRTK